jgi:hypothetical protein
LEGTKSRFGEACATDGECETNKCTKAVCAFAIPSGTAKPSLVAANVTKTITFSGAANKTVEFPGNLGLALSSSSSAVVVQVVVGNAPSDAPVSATGSFNTYYHFDTLETGFTATLQFAYTDELLATFNATNQPLHWSRYDEDTGDWEVQDCTYVDEVAKIVGCQTDHFSEWTVVAGTFSAAVLMVPSLAAVVVLAVFSVAFVC